MWPKTGGELILPPVYKLRVGRPKKLRMREPGEDNNRTKLRRGHTITICSRCQQLGHNSRSCTASPADTSGQDGENAEATEIGTQQS
ncbi:Zinc finger, CCHC-type superfamily [Sesbania bispinosa]|nr:Zinc finger, CCHC-type superfamily [Sesbania bispinosa]